MPSKFYHNNIASFCIESSIFLDSGKLCRKGCTESAGDEDIYDRSVSPKMTI